LAQQEATYRKQSLHKRIGGGTGRRHARDRPKNGVVRRLDAAAVLRAKHLTPPTCETVNGKNCVRGAEHSWSSTGDVVLEQEGARLYLELRICTTARTRRQSQCKGPRNVNLFFKLLASIFKCLEIHTMIHNTKNLTSKNNWYFAIETDF
jgi:hypothetical protein